jgi:4-aminobutyrate aminotransferase-like enzyme
MTLSAAYAERTAAFDADFDPSAGRPVIERGYGATLVDVDGHESIDLSDIIANVGHCHPTLVHALHEASSRMITNKSGTTHPARAALVERLAALFPLDAPRVYLVASGSEAIDWSFRLARRATGRHEILSFWGGVYGRTYGAMSLNGVRSRRRFGPAMPGVVHAPYAYCYRCPFDKRPEDCGLFCIDHLDEVLRHASCGDVAALVVEPYQGVGGMIFPPEGYLTRLQGWARARGILFILDEVQSAFGRTGRRLALEWEGLRPDMVVVGKGLGGGIGIAAVVAEAALWRDVAAGELSGGNGAAPIACAAALAVLDILEEEGLSASADDVGAYLIGRLRRWTDDVEQVGDVRGKGLAIGVEFVRDRATKEPFPELVRDLARRAYRAGVYLSARGHVLDVRPPLVITRDQAERAADILDRSLRESLDAMVP